MFETHDTFLFLVRNFKPMDTRGNIEMVVGNKRNVKADHAFQF